MKAILKGHTTVSELPPLDPIDPIEIYGEKELITKLELLIPLTPTEYGALLYKLLPDGTHEFLTGLTNYYLQDRPIKRDKSSQIPQVNIVAEIPDWFYPHQKEGVQIGLKKRRATLEVPTSGGKTNMIGAIAEALIEHCPVLVSVPTQKLLTQMRDELKDYFNKKNKGIDIGLIGSGHWNPKQLTIGIPDTFISRQDNPEVQDYCLQVGGWLADECHTLANPTGMALSKLLGNARYRIGFSATPEPTSGLRPLLDGIHGPIAFRVRPQELIEKGSILEPLIKVYNVPYEKAIGQAFKIGKGFFYGRTVKEAMGLEYSHPLYNKFYDYLILMNQERNELIADIIDGHLRADRGVLLVIVKKVDSKVNHVDLINQVLESKFQYTLPVIKGSLGTKAVEKFVEDLRDRNIPAAIAGPNILKEGVNIHSLGGLVYACGGRSKVELIQRVGRVLRRAEGKGRPYIYDLQDGYKWFNSQAKERVNLYKETYGEDCVEYAS